MTLEEALENSDMEEIIDSMTAYACSRLKNVRVKDMGGLNPDDFVQEVLMKVVNGERDWSKAKCSFKGFLFGCLKSHFSSFFKSLNYQYVDKLPEIQDNELPVDESYLKETIIEMLKCDGANQEELDVFECWADGLTKPAEIADLFANDVKYVYNIIKRLERRLIKIRPLLIKIV